MGMRELYSMKGVGWDGGVGAISRARMMSTESIGDAITRCLSRRHSEARELQEDVREGMSSKISP